MWGNRPEGEDSLNNCRECERGPRKARPPDSSDLGLDCRCRGVLRQSLLCLLDQGGKRGGLIGGELREHATVNFDSREVETLDETVIGHAVRTGSGVNTLDPQATEVTLACTTVTVAVDQRVNDLLFGLAVQTRTLTAVTLCALEDYSTLLGGVNRILVTCHDSFPSL